MVYQVISGQTGKAVSKTVSKAIANQIAKELRRSTGGSFRVKKVPNPFKWQVRKRVRKALKKYVRKNASIRKTKKALKSMKRRGFPLRGALRRRGVKASPIYYDLAEKVRRTPMRKDYPHINPPRVKGRKVKGGRAVTLRNFTGTIVRESDGRVQILGRGKRK